MIKSLSTSVITMLVVYSISFAAFASPKDPTGAVGHLKFYDIPAMLGEKKDITVDLTSPYDVYVTKLYDSVDDVTLDNLNFKLQYPSTNEYVQPTVFDQKSDDFNVVARTNTFTAITNTPEWNALIMKPKNFSDPGYIYYYVNGHVYGIDIFFNSEPKYLKDTVIESLLVNGYFKPLGSYVMFKDSYKKGSSIISYQHNYDNSNNLDGSITNTNYTYIRFRNKDLVDNLDKISNSTGQSVDHRAEIQKKLGL
jgi:hypothetical protein